MRIVLGIWIGLLALPLWGQSVHQPLMDYGIQFPGERRGAAPRINPFDNFTHLGTDFGWMGPGEARMDAGFGQLSVRADGAWTGAWHSLAGLAVEHQRLLNPRNVLGLGGPRASKATLQGITLEASGVGRLRLELLGDTRTVVWSQQVELQPGEIKSYQLPVDAAALPPVKFLNWVAEPGVELHIESLGMNIERPEISPEEWLFRISLGKLRRCHDPASGLTRDRAHLTAGRFDAIPVTGMYALAAAVAVAEGVLDADQVKADLRHTLEVFESMPKCHGFLPHFTRRGAEGKPEIHPGTEFSTVDTAIALQSMRLASLILEDREAADRVAKMIQALDFDRATDADGWVHHGWKEDGATLLANTWGDWGGETALVLAQEAMVEGRTPRGRMSVQGKVFNGAAFIAEIQSLFYPDFDSMEPDLVSRTVWPEVRRRLLEQQSTYLERHWPASAALRAGIFGFSAGEAGRPGAGYTSNGSELPGVRWIHPHAMVMMCGLTGGDLALRIRKLEEAGFLHPFGLPEAIEIDFRDSNPMLGGLNAGFETLSAYHAWKKRGAAENRIDRACLEDPLMRRGVARFYPAQVPNP